MTDMKSKINNVTLMLKTVNYGHSWINKKEE